MKKRRSRINVDNYFDQWYAKNSARIQNVYGDNKRGFKRLFEADSRASYYSKTALKNDLDTMLIGLENPNKAELRKAKMTAINKNEMRNEYGDLRRLNLTMGESVVGDAWRELMNGVIDLSQRTSTRELVTDDYEGEVDYVYNIKGSNMVLAHVRYRPKYGTYEETFVYVDRSEINE